MKDTVLRVEPGDRLFLYSDGYYDQKSREGKKMFKGNMVRQIEATLRLGLSEQMEALGNFFIAYKGESEQIDDATLFAVEINGLQGD
jgi:serine phosphatase RsbU (regulator of sigma subunit)